MDVSTISNGGPDPAIAGFMNDFPCLQAGIHCVLAEVSGTGKDYCGDGYFTGMGCSSLSSDVTKLKYCKFKKHCYQCGKRSNSK